MTQEPKPIRAFIAIPLPEAIQGRIAAFQRDWQTDLPGSFIRWTPVEQIHLTLRFLGDVPAAAVAEIESALRQAAEGFPSFELTAAGSGCFPNAHRPRVLWIGVGGDTQALAQLQGRVAEATQSWGENEAREFRAHLTIGRVKDTPPPAVREIAHRAQTLSCGELGRWRASEVLLMRSELSPEGARHSALAKIGLSAPPPA